MLCFEIENKIHIVCVVSFSIIVSFYNGIVGPSLDYANAGGSAIVETMVMAMDPIDKNQGNKLWQLRRLLEQLGNLPGEEKELEKHVDDVVYNVRSSSEFAPLSLEYMERAFINKFPFGRGGMGERRDPPVSSVEAARHYVALSLGTFQDGPFHLHLQNWLRVRKFKTRLFGKALGKVHLSDDGKAADGNRTFAAAVGALSEKEITLGCAYAIQCEKNARLHLPRPVPPVGLRQVAVDFFASLMKSYQRTGPEWSSRMETIACVYRYGLAHYWWTATPEQTSMTLVFLLALGRQSPPEEIKRVMNHEFEKYQVCFDRSHWFDIVCVCFLRFSVSIPELWLCSSIASSKCSCATCLAGTRRSIVLRLAKWVKAERRSWWQNPECWVWSQTLCTPWNPRRVRICTCM